YRLLLFVHVCCLRVTLYDTMSHTMSSLTVLHTDATERLILQSALAVLEDVSFHGLTVRAVALKAGMSERTIFRYFATRDEFLDAVAAEFTRLLNMPPPPQTLD